MARARRSGGGQSGFDADARRATRSGEVAAARRSSRGTDWCRRAAARTTSSSSLTSIAKTQGGAWLLRATAARISDRSPFARWPSNLGGVEGLRARSCLGPKEWRSTRKLSRSGGLRRCEARSAAPAGLHPSRTFPRVVGGQRGLPARRTRALLSAERQLHQTIFGTAWIAPAVRTMESSASAVRDIMAVMGSLGCRRLLGAQRDRCLSPVLRAHGGGPPVARCGGSHARVLRTREMLEQGGRTMRILSDQSP